MELEFIRVVAEEALAKMAHDNDLGALLTVWCHRLTTEREIVLLLAFFLLFHWRMVSAGFLKRIFPRRPHHHLLVSFEQNVPSGF